VMGTKPAQSQRNWWWANGLSIGSIYAFNFFKFLSFFQVQIFTVGNKTYISKQPLFFFSFNFMGWPSFLFIKFRGLKLKRWPPAVAVNQNTGKGRRGDFAQCESNPRPSTQPSADTKKLVASKSTDSLHRRVRSWRKWHERK
jgi:hypothetical protein